VPIEIFPGQFTNSGASKSITVIGTIHDAVFPELSVTVHVTLVVPTGKVAPFSVVKDGAALKL
jgi:hypothetical protein